MASPKVQGAWTLHQQTADLPLDFFVVFSSVASVLGSPGQSNYAAANAFMDALAWYRRASGLPALSINWGPWADVGMATSDAVMRRLMNDGWQPMGATQGCAKRSSLKYLITILSALMVHTWLPAGWVRLGLRSLGTSWQPGHGI